MHYRDGDRARERDRDRDHERQREKERDRQPERGRERGRERGADERSAPGAQTVPSGSAESWERKLPPQFLDLAAKCRLEKSAAQVVFRRLCSTFDSELISSKWPSHAAELLTRRLCDDGRQRTSREQFVASAQEGEFVKVAAGFIKSESKRKLLDLCSSLLLPGPVRSPKSVKTR